MAGAELGGCEEGANQRVLSQSRSANPRYSVVSHEIAFVVEKYFHRCWAELTKKVVMFGSWLGQAISISVARWYKTNKQSDKATDDLRTSIADILHGER